MPIVFNDTALPHFQFSNTDNRGREFGVLILKAAFDIEEDGECVLSDEQEPFFFKDIYHGEVNVTSIKFPSDLVSYKPDMDFILDAVAHAPGGEPSPAWQVGVRISSNHGLIAEKYLRVTGPRRWEPDWLIRLTDEQRRDWKRHRRLFSGWRLTEPDPVVSVPIHYELAYGGSLCTGVDETGREIIRADERNPIGRGWLDEDFTDHTAPAPAPQIESLENPIREPYRRYEAQGIGPISPAWLPRRPLGGTYDDHWRDNVWPKWPQDYNFSFNNSASPKFLLSGFPQGSITIEFDNLRPGRSNFKIIVPDLNPALLLDGDAGFSIVRPHLDTMIVSISPDDLFDCRVFAVWRAPFNPNTTHAIAIDVPDQDERLQIEKEAEPIAVAAHPSECGVSSELMERNL